MKKLLLLIMLLELWHNGYTQAQEKVTSYRLPVAGNHEPVTRNVQPETITVTGYRLPVTDKHEPLTMNVQPETIAAPEPVTRYVQPETASGFHGGAEQYYYMGENQVFTIVPVVYYETGKNWYIEGRYNYEALNTVSVYAGKTFEKKSALSYSASPIIGVVAGSFNGGSAGVNSEADYKRYSFSSQLQYTFSFKHKAENFLYSWSDLSYQALSNFYAGFSIQQTKLYKEECKLEKGIFVKASFNKWSVPLYVFSPAAKERYFVLGLNYDW